MSAVHLIDLHNHHHRHNKTVLPRIDNYCIGIHGCYTALELEKNSYSSS